MTTGTRSYRTSDWDRFRKEVIELDGGACRTCQRSAADGVVLQVHHLKYLPGRQPWEYSYEDCETLCKGCHAAEHGIIPPKTNWQYFGTEDLGGLYGSCELCGTAIRHVFYIFHTNWGCMQVGTYCCDHLTSTQIASNHMESKLRFESRMKRFLSSKRWSIDLGNTHTIVQKGVSVRIFPVNEGFKIQVYQTQGKNIYPSLDDAKEKVFSVIESGAAERYQARSLT